MSKRDKIIVVSTIILIIILIFVIIFFQLNPNFNSKKENSENISVEETQKSLKDTEALIQEVRGIAQEIEKNKENSFSQIVKISDSNGEEKEAVVIAPGTNPISLETGEVVTNTGEISKNNIVPGADGAPQSSYPIATADLEKLPENVIKLNLTHNSITPSEFRVKAGQVVSLTVTSGEKMSHIFRFDNESLSSVAVALSPEKTKVITFNAPEIPGEYIYFSAVADYRENGAIGKMIVE